MRGLPVPARQERVELRVENSVFVASLAPASTVDEAREFIARIRQEFSDASHNVPAFLIGHGSTTLAHSHDDGEPSGTAGRPALAVLQGSGLGDVVVVVTRYFGGTKLGRGGLVRAYGDAVRAVVAAVPRASKVATQTAMVALPYRLLEQVRRAVRQSQGQILDEEFAADVTLTARFVAEDLGSFHAALQQLSDGSLDAVVVQTDEATIMLQG
jgi:uncharacterized YigZ family protein